MVSITEYSYVLAERRPVEGNAIIKEAPIDDERLLADMMIECRKKIGSMPDVIYAAHSLPFVKGSKSVSLSDAFGVPVFYLSGLPCAITHFAVKAAVSQIEGGRYNRVLILGADKAYSLRERSFFGTIMGDMVIGIMLERGTGLHEVIASRTDTVLYAAEGEDSPPESIAEYRRTLPILLRNSYRCCLEEAGLASVDYIAPHTSSKAIWDAFSKTAKFDRRRILDDNIVHTGHFNSNDSFYHYFTRCEDETIRQGQLAMLINPGFGGTRGCTILRRM